MSRRHGILASMFGYAPLPPDEVIVSTPWIAPYERLAQVWDEVHWPGQPHSYNALLTMLCEELGIAGGAYLDIACGTGKLLAEFGQRFQRRMGIDISPHMLEVAHKRTLPDTDFICSDFTCFDVGEKFDLVSCALDSMNYVQGPEALLATFLCVKSHLKERGIFVFDALTASQMLLSNYVKAFNHPCGRGWLVMNFNPVEQRDRSFVLYDDAFEPHHRLPLEPEAVLEAAERAGLEPLRGLQARGYERPVLPFMLDRNYYVLRLKQFVTSSEST